MGVASDCKYTQQYGNTQNATTNILTNWNTASALYKVNTRDTDLLQKLMLFADDFQCQSWYHRATSAKHNVGVLFYCLLSFGINRFST